MLTVLLAALRRDLLLAWRRRGDALTTLIFFVIVASLFPFGVGSESNLLRAVAPGVLWVAALLATLISLPRMFASDYADGTLEQMALAGEPLVLVVLGKALAHWLTTGLPLALAAPLMGFVFDIPQMQAGVAFLSLLAGTPALTLLGAVGAALTLPARGAGVLVAVLILPLYVPVLIFGAGAAGEGSAGNAAAHLLLLGGASSLSLAVCPWAAAAAVRMALD